MPSIMLMVNHSKLFVSFYGRRTSSNNKFKAINSFLKYTNGGSARGTSTEGVLPIERDLKEVFKFKNSNTSNWIIENKARILCCKYSESKKEDRWRFVRILASQYDVQHDKVRDTALKLVQTQTENNRQKVQYERNLKNQLMPLYYWLFTTIGRLENGVKFLVDLRTDVLEVISDTTDTDENFLVRQLNTTLQDLLLLWFSVGFLHLERVTWQSSCDILQKISEYEAIHPIKNWLDLKHRVGPYRRCYIFTHPAMPREPLIVLHTALCSKIPETLEDIKEDAAAVNNNEQVTFIKEDESKIKSAIFYSISATQKGLQGVQLGYYLIKEVAHKVTTEFPTVYELASLSPIPSFNEWLTEKMKQNVNIIFTKDESECLQNILQQSNIVEALNKLFLDSQWTKNKELCSILKAPLLRACAWYLYNEKRRNYALNNVANFHLSNGAVMWRINWLADTSPRRTASSFGIMVNYRYYLNECERNSRNYIENHFVNASESVKCLANEAEILRK